MTTTPPWEDIDSLRIKNGHAQYERTEITEGTPDDSVISDFRPVPELGEAAFHGPIGAFVQAAAPFTEADPAAILASAIAGYGAIIGPAPHVVAGNEHHTGALFPVIVGDTAKARKGTAGAVARQLHLRLDERFVRERTLGGFGSGEALIDAFTPDEDDKPTDVRLLVNEPEFASLLKIVGREGSILGQNVRKAWDGYPLEARTRGQGNRRVADYHISIVGHITADELRSTLTSTEVFGGTGNRLTFIFARRAQLLPEGGNVPERVFDEHGAVLKATVEHARKRALLKRSPDAEKCWHELYYELAEDTPPGLLGALTARAEPQILRLALLYALADTSQAVEVGHLHAARAVWDYSRSTVEHIFGDRLGDPTADRLLAEIRRAGPAGLDFTAQSALFGRSVPANRLTAARQRLEQAGLIVTEAEKTGGRDRMVSRASRKRGQQ